MGGSLLTWLRRIAATPELRPLTDLERRTVWILGSPRSGSTWFSGLLHAASPRVVEIKEPTIGLHLGVPVSALIGVEDRDSASSLRVADLRAEVPSYFFSEAYADSWIPALRRMVLSRFQAEVDKKAGRAAKRVLVAVKEPDGSIGADLLLSAMPQTRLVFLLRDGRDVVDSEVDGLMPGGWVNRIAPGFGLEQHDRLEFIRRRAFAWVIRTEVVQRAFATHDESRRIIVRYEDLLDDAGGIMRRVFDHFGIEADDSDIERRVEATRFDRLLASQKGSGKFARSATPGGWRENLNLDEQGVLQSVMGGKLTELGYA